MRRQRGFHIINLFYRKTESREGQITGRQSSSIGWPSFGRHCCVIIRVMGHQGKELLGKFLHQRAYMPLLLVKMLWRSISIYQHIYTQLHSLLWAKSVPNCYTVCSSPYAQKDTRVQVHHILWAAFAPVDLQWTYWGTVQSIQSKSRA